MKLEMDKKLLLVISAVLVLICLLITVLALALSSKPDSASYDLAQASISLERGPCFGFCPVYTVTVHGSGKVEVNGKQNVQQGYFTYTISKSDAQELIKSAIDMDFFDLQNTYRDDRITDLDSATITLKAGDQTKAIYMYGFAPTVPQKLLDLAANIDKVSGAREGLGEPIVEPTKPLYL